jgi:mRNA-degrading endonuclease RelE of RelBE toxin-antitoxin system
MPLTIEWSDEAKADIRRLDKPTALHIFDTLLRFVRTGQGDIKQLKGELTGKLRLRCGDYRMIISPSGNTLRIYSVRHRKEAYR